MHEDRRRCRMAAGHRKPAPLHWIERFGADIVERFSRKVSMSWLRWFSSKKSTPGAVAGAGLHAGESTRPQDGLRDDDAGPAHRKGERIARRERLYGVVRECMVNAGVLSSSYKFKVLS